MLIQFSFSCARHYTNIDLEKQALLTQSVLVIFPRSQSDQASCLIPRPLLFVTFYLLPLFFLFPPTPSLQSSLLSFLSSFQACHDLPSFPHFLAFDTSENEDSICDLRDRSMYIYISTKSYPNSWALKKLGSR